MNIPERLRELGCVRTTYLGDGVYCGYDGYQVWLLTEREHGIHEIALEEGVLSNLFNYAGSIAVATAAPIKDADL